MTHRSEEEEEQEAGEELEEATMNRTDLKWIHDEDGEDDVFEDDDAGEALDDEEVWLRLRAFIYEFLFFFTVLFSFLTK